MDHFVEAGLALLGARPPDEVFVHYEWVSASGSNGIPAGYAGYTWPKSNHSSLVRSTRLIFEHELAHAVHNAALPAGAPFLEEGFAVLLDARRPFLPVPWPEGASIDDAVEISEFHGDDFVLAWYLVSQIVRDHGFEGLRDLWLAVPRGSSAEKVRNAYEELFGESLDVLLEPYPDGACPEPCFSPVRYACNFAVCPWPSTPWEGGHWEADAPNDCEYDPLAVGPVGDTLDSGNVWHERGLDIAGDWDLAERTSVGVGANLMGCYLECWDSSTHYVSVPPGFPDDLPFPPDGTAARLIAGPYRVEVGRYLQDLPAEEDGAFQIDVVPRR